MRYLYLSILLLFVWSHVSAQNAAPLTDNDKREIKAEAKRVIETHLNDLLNSITSDGLMETGRKLIIANSFIPSENQIFDINAIIEDDVNPDFAIAKKGPDVKVQRYLENLNLFYTKTAEPSIRISEVNVTDVRIGAEYPFVLVHFKIHPQSTHRNKPGVKYPATLRTAELRAEQIDKQWKLFITGLRYYKAATQDNTVAKQAVKPAPTTPAKTAETTQAVTQKKEPEKKPAETPRVTQTTPPATKTEPLTQPATQPVKSAETAEPKREDPVRVAEKSPEMVPQKSSAALHDLEIQAARYKKKGMLFKVGAGAAVAGAAATFVILNSSYSDYKSQLKQNNADLESWWGTDGNGEKFGNIEDYKAKPESIISFGKPGIYFVGAGVVAGGVLWFLGSSNSKKAKDYRNQIEQKRKQLSITPQVSGSQRYAGLHISYRF